MPDLIRTSSVIRRFSYDSEDHVLRVVFVSGRVYDYFDVPKAIYRAFQEAESKGGFLNAEIRPRYRYKEAVS
jgi:hypothetical protein